MASKNRVLPRRFGGKVAIVTAGTLGIGYAIAERLTQEGAKVMISSRKQDNVDEAVTELRNKGYNVRGVVCHVANAEDRENLVKELGAIISKTTLLGLVKNLAPQLAEMNNRVNGLAPGRIKTEMNRALWSNDDIMGEMANAIKRLGTSEEMAGVAAFLASDDASYITAETVEANGGGPSRL